MLLDISQGTGYYIWQILTTFLTLLFGGTSLVQLLNNRELKRKLAAEADSSEAEADDIVVKRLQGEVVRLSNRLEEMDERYAKLEHKYYQLMESVTQLKEQEHLFVPQIEYENRTYIQPKERFADGLLFQSKYLWKGILPI